MVISSYHDLYDLKQLLEQTKDKGDQHLALTVKCSGARLSGTEKVSSPEGQFRHGMRRTSRRNLADIPAPALFTTNCLMPPKKSYADRVFTTEVVSYPEMVRHRQRERFYAGY
ncbi:MAG: hypothetical protein ACLTR6_16310 [Clostridium fessum]